MAKTKQYGPKKKVMSQQTPVSMRVTNENVASIRDVDPIGEIGDTLTPESSL